MVCSVNYYFISKPELRVWWLRSFEEESGKPSGKALSVYALINFLIFALLLAVIEAKNHILPKYMFEGLLMLIGSLYVTKAAPSIFGKKKDQNSDPKDSVG